jgi:hypothetical protein
MNWIKQNKFEAMLLLVVVVIAIGIFMFGNSQGAAYEEDLGRFEDANSQIAVYENAAPFPNPAHVDDRRVQVTAFQGDVEGLQESLLAFRPAEFRKISPAEFTTRLNATSEKLKALYGDKIEFPDAWQAGFEAYTSSPPKDQATDFLSYELAAMEWIFTTLAKAEPSALLNVYRPKLPIETGASMEPEAPRTSKGKRSRSKVASKPYYKLPLELTFRAKESTLREFLSTLAGSEEHFVVVRSMRVSNTNPNAPSESDAEFDDGGGDAAEEGEGAFDAFSGFEFPEEDEGEDGDEEAVEEEEVAEGQRNLGQVLGAEELNVFLNLEIHLFRDDVELPGAGK